MTTSLPDWQVISPVEEQPHPLSSQKKKISVSGGGGGGWKTQLSRVRDEPEADSDSPTGRCIYNCVHVGRVSLKYTDYIYMCGVNVSMNQRVLQSQCISNNYDSRHVRQCGIKSTLSTLYKSAGPVC